MYIYMYIYVHIVGKVDEIASNRRYQLNGLSREFIGKPEYRDFDNNPDAWISARNHHDNHHHHTLLTDGYGINLISSRVNRSNTCRFYYAP